MHLRCNFRAQLFSASKQGMTYAFIPKAVLNSPCIQWNVLRCRAQTVGQLLTHMSSPAKRHTKACSMKIASQVHIWTVYSKLRWHRQVSHRCKSLKFTVRLSNESHRQGYSLYNKPIFTISFQHILKNLTMFKHKSIDSHYKNLIFQQQWKHTKSAKKRTLPVSQNRKSNYHSIRILPAVFITRLSCVP